MQIKRLRENHQKSVLSVETPEGMMLHEKAEEMPNLPVARFTRLPGDNRLVAFAAEKPASIYMSEDNGKNWERCENFPPSSDVAAGPTGGFLCTSKGTLVASFVNLAEKTGEQWDPERKDKPGAQLPSYTARSLDGGKTWQDFQRIHSEWTGAIRDMIETSDGRLVFTSQKLRHNPGRHTVLTYCSDDEGQTWHPSNVIDLGGNGHHGGVCEATLVELNDGHLLKYIRTNWGQFWRALSPDKGLMWHPYGPAGVDTSSAPGFLHRLSSGRIVLAWNRELPEGEDEYPLKGGDCNWSATPVSNFREELSISFSDDEGESWSAPVVIARNEGKVVSYPYVFEVEPGVLWITAHLGKLRMRLFEQDFAGDA